MKVIKIRKQKPYMLDNSQNLIRYVKIFLSGVESLRKISRTKKKLNHTNKRQVRKLLPDKYLKQKN